MFRLRQSHTPNKFVIICGVLILVAAAAFALTQRNHSEAEPAASYAVPPTAEIHVTEDGFLPQTISVNKGTAVIWSNVDTSPHRIAASPFRTHTSLPSLESRTNIDSGGTYRYIFEKPGTYQYQDELHPDITGTVIVK